MSANPPTLGFITRAAAGRTQVAYGEKVRRLERGRVLRDSLLPGKPPEARQ